MEGEAMAESMAVAAATHTRTIILVEVIQLVINLLLDLSVKYVAKQGMLLLKCYHRFGHSYQDEEKHIAAYASTPSYQIDTNWYSDTGATDHITSDLDRLIVKERYNGKDRVQADDGPGLFISHVGHSQLHTSNKNIKLNNILHVPQVTRNLLLVHRFTSDNDVYFEFHPNFFVVKDRATKSHLFQGKRRGLNPFASTIPRTALLSIKPSQDQWHYRLGHPL